jgi:hypothetical protein
MHCSKYKQQQKFVGELDPEQTQFATFHNVQNEKSVHLVFKYWKDCTARESKECSPGLQLKKEKTSIDDISGMMTRKNRILLRAHFPLSSLALTRKCTKVGIIHYQWWGEYPWD